MSNICTPYYDNQYVGFANSYGAVATNVAIQHPNVFYFVLNGSWSSYNSLEFWNKGNTVRTVNNDAVHKTIYSPSPSNYTEPKSAAFTGFTTTGQNSTEASQFNKYGNFNKGYFFYSQLNFTGDVVYFHALGFRSAYSGQVNSATGGAVIGLNATNYCWSAGPYHDFYFDSVNIFPHNIDPSAYGTPIRATL